MKKKRSGGRFHSCHSGEHLLWNSHALWNGKAATGRVSPQRQGTGGQQKKRLSPLWLLVHDSHDDQFHWRPHASLYLSRVLLLCNNRHSRWASCPQTMSERSCSGWEQKSRTDLPSQNQTTVSGKANKPEETYILFLILVFHSTQGATRCGCFRAVVLTEDWLSLAPTGKPLLYQVAMETGSRLGDGGKQRKEEWGGLFQSLWVVQRCLKKGVGFIRHSHLKCSLCALLEGGLCCSVSVFHRKHQMQQMRSLPPTCHWNVISLQILFEFAPLCWVKHVSRFGFSCMRCFGRSGPNRNPTCSHHRDQNSHDGWPATDSGWRFESTTVWGFLWCSFPKNIQRLFIEREEKCYFKGKIEVMKRHRLIKYIYFFIPTVEQNHFTLKAMSKQKRVKNK